MIYVKRLFLLYAVLFLSTAVGAKECKLVTLGWGNLCSVLQKRITQSHLKMKLEKSVVVKFENFLLKSNLSLSSLKELQHIAPKTTIELLMAIAFRCVTIEDAEGIARYLNTMVLSYDFENINAFDENTSHIIGRDWHQIDYSNEGMTWKKQKEKYQCYNITNFKTLENIKKFFKVESKLPYFKKTYRPKNLQYFP